MFKNKIWRVNEIESNNDETFKEFHPIHKEWPFNICIKEDWIEEIIREIEHKILKKKQ